MRCVLIGNYGVGNIGDEALREYFLRTFPDITWTVITANPKYAGQVPRLPLGFRSLFFSWWQTLIALSVSDAVVFGGGSLFTDSESVFACILWWWHAFVARLIGVPVLLASQGVGPFRTSLGKRLARSTFESASFVSVRDSASLQRVNAWNLSTDPVLTFDPAFVLFGRTQRVQQEKKMLAIIPRGNASDRFFIEAASCLKKNFDDVRILLLQPDPKEAVIAARLQALSTIPCVVVPVTSVDALLTEIAGASEVLSQRYHGALAALAIGVPVTIVSQTEGDKLDALRMLQGDPARLSELLVLIKKGEEELRKNFTQ